MLKTEEEIKLHPPGISRLVLEHMPLIISISISFKSLNTKWSCIKETISERNCWTGLTGLSDAGWGRVGRVGQHSGWVGPPAASAASVALLLLVRMCLFFCSVTVNGVKGSRSCFVSLSFWSTAELQLHSLSYFFSLPNPDFFFMLIY